MSSYALPGDPGQASIEQNSVESGPRAEFKKESRSWSDRFPMLLRRAGAIAVLVSLYNFLSQGWSGHNDLVKYCLLLGSTVGLAAIALLIGHFFKEGKSPRLLLTLGLVSVPVNFAILGAFIFYGFADLSGIGYPRYVAWQVDSLTTALLTTALACLALIPIVWLGFRTLVRGMSLQMMAFFLLSCVVLLIPLRDPILVAVMATVLGFLTLMISARTARQKIEAQTREGKMALLLQFLPLAILVGRNLWLYATDVIVIWAACAMAFIAIRQISPLIRSNSLGGALLDGLSLFSALATGMLSTVVLAQANMTDSMAMLLGVLVASGMSYEISLRDGVNEKFYRACAMAVAISGALGNMLFAGGIAISLTVLLAGIGLLVVSYLVQQRSLAITGGILAAAGFIDQCLNALHWFDLGAWIVLLLLGVSGIVMASALETRSDHMRHFLAQHRKQVGKWCF